MLFFDLLMRLFVLTLFLGAPGTGRQCVWLGRSGVLHGQTSWKSLTTLKNEPTGTGNVIISRDMDAKLPNTHSIENISCLDGVLDAMEYCGQFLFGGR